VGVCVCVCVCVWQVWEVVPERRIRLADAEQVGKWFNQHTSYLIINDDTGIEVRRRYNDFVWLRTTVSSISFFLLLLRFPLFLKKLPFIVDAWTCPLSWRNS